MRTSLVLTIAVLVLAAISISGCTDQPSNTLSNPQLNDSNAPPNANSHTITWISGGPQGYIDLGNFAGEGSVEPYNCTLTDGTLPNGFTLESCILSGRVSSLPEGTTEVLNPPFTVVINDSSKPPVTKTVEFTIQFIKNDMVLKTYKLSTCTVGELCTAKIVDTVTGGTEPYSFQADTFANGAPPLGMTVNPQDGTLTGTPSVAGDYKFNICARDSVGAMLCDETSVTVNPQATEPVDNDDNTVNGVTEPSATVDSTACTLVSKTDIQGVGIHTGEIVGTNYVFRLTGSGTATGPVGTRVYVASAPDDSGEWGTYLSDDTASFTTDSWTDTGQSSGYSPDQNKYNRGQGDPETTAWHFDGGEYPVQATDFSGPFSGDTVHFTIYALYYDGINHNQMVRSGPVTCSG